MRKLLIGLVALAVLLVAADRISVAIAENQISDRLTSAYGLPDKPGVTITGFPFLTQVAAGDYHQIDLSASQVPADGATLRDLSVRLTGVHATVSQVLGGGSSMVTADRAAGTLAYRGARVPVSATVALGVSGTGISVTPVRVRVLGLPGLSMSAYSSQLRIVVPLSTLPLHLHLTSVHVTQDRLRIGAAARDVQFART